MLQTSIPIAAPANKFRGCVHPGAWTPERVETLRRLWLDGEAASIIADRLGEVTRNAVIGKVHRLGLPGRAATKRQPRRTSPRRDRAGRVVMRRPAQPVRGRPALPLDLPPAPAALMLSVAQLTEATCLWPVGDPRLPGFGFCGAPRAGRQPYCAHHDAIGHQQKGGGA
jgi:GcrA cell cycle regulator